MVMTQEPIHWRYRFHIFLAYVWGLNFREYPQNSYGQTYGTKLVAPFLGSWRSPIAMGSTGSPQEWQEAEVCQWLSEVFLAPQELVQMVEQQAITGKVLWPGGKTWKPGKTLEKLGKTLEKPGKTLEKPGKTWKNPGKTWKNLEKPGKTWKNPGKTWNQGNGWKKWWMVNMLKKNAGNIWNGWKFSTETSFRVDFGVRRWANGVLEPDMRIMRIICRRWSQD